MGKQSFSGIAQKARKTNHMFVGVNQKARKVKSAFVGINGKARQWYSAETPAQIGGYAMAHLRGGTSGNYGWHILSVEARTIIKYPVSVNTSVKWNDYFFTTGSKKYWYTHISAYDSTTFTLVKTFAKRNKLGCSGQYFFECYKDGKALKYRQLNEDTLSVISDLPGFANQSNEIWWYNYGSTGTYGQKTNFAFFTYNDNDDGVYSGRNFQEFDFIAGTIIRVIYQYYGQASSNHLYLQTTSFGNKYIVRFVSNGIIVLDYNTLSQIGTLATYTGGSILISDSQPCGDTIKL